MSDTKDHRVTKKQRLLRNSGLTATLCQLVMNRKVLILGVGNPSCGDDGLGPGLIARLNGRVSAKLLDTEDVPENYLGVITMMQPEVVLIIDAVDMGAMPGELALISTSQLGNTIINTHRASLALLSKVIETDTGARVFLLAVQPETVEFGAPMSADVAMALDGLEDLFLYLFD